MRPPSPEERKVITGYVQGLVDEGKETRCSLAIHLFTLYHANPKPQAWDWTATLRDAEGEFEMQGSVLAYLAERDGVYSPPRPMKIRIAGDGTRRKTTITKLDTGEELYVTNLRMDWEPTIGRRILFFEYDSAPTEETVVPHALRRFDSPLLDLHSADLRIVSIEIVAELSKDAVPPRLRPAKDGNS